MAKVMASNFHEIRIPIPPQIFAGQVLQEQAMCVLLFDLMSVLEAGNDCGGKEVTPPRAKCHQLVFGKNRK